MSSNQESEIPPEGYLVTDSPNLAEIGTLCCPYVGCDAFVWHEGLYACGQCGAVFACAPPLERHGRDSGHVIEWFCNDKECEMAGKPFETYRIYLEHFRLSPAHQNEAEAEDILDALGTADAVSPSQDQQDDNSLITSDIFICGEPCCHRYGFNFRCKSEYTRHAEAPSHISAANINKTLLESMQPGPALAAEQEAIQSRRCNAPDCTSFGDTFSSAKSFFSHVGKLEHRKAWAPTSGTLLDTEEESLALPGMSIDAGGTSGTCMNERCPKFGATFNTPGKMKRHAHSFAHATTEEDLESMDESLEVTWVSSEFEGMQVAEGMALWKCVKRGCRRFDKTMTPINNAKNHSSSVSHATAGQDVSMSPETPMTPFATPNSTPTTALSTPMNLDTPVPTTPLSPSAGRGPSAAMALVTPTKTPTSLRSPPSRAMIKLRRSPNTSSQVKRRQDELERRNRELEDRVKRLEEQLARVLGDGVTQETADGNGPEVEKDVC
ncbi:hypothetical protein N0V84_000414 [Fusarium piperis]|uniref:C2H2-type domain-containing protein n=1 Tax=Fusarium piperis TaxID=1435070 RepID=A0A9W9BUR4_9HYPO|nr:hypothetical protein N0V84_000414 [Fusarium piperis]